jgi:hypothetical protein
MARALLGEAVACAMPGAPGHRGPPLLSFPHANVAEFTATSPCVRRAPDPGESGRT